MPLWSFMVLFAVSGPQAFSLGSAGNGPQDKTSEELLLRLQQEIGKIRTNQINYVAEEEQQQEEYNKKGELKKQRKLISNYYRVRLGGMDNIIECREVVSVNGEPTGDYDKLQRIFFSESESAVKQINEVMKQNKKYNLGRRRDTNQPWVGLRFADRDRHEHAVYYIDPKPSDAGEMLQLRFQEVDEETLFRKGVPFSKPTPATGQYLFASEGKQFLGYDISVHEKTGAILFRLVARYSRHKDEKLLPKSFEEYTYHENGQVKTHSVSEFKNYRRFTSDAKIIQYELIE